jgi:hypothetical protein
MLDHHPSNLKGEFHRKGKVQLTANKHESLFTLTRKLHAFALVRLAKTDGCLLFISLSLPQQVQQAEFELWHIVPNIVVYSLRPTSFDSYNIMIIMYTR